MFGPNVMRGPDEESMNMMYPCDVMSFLIDNSDSFIIIVRIRGSFVVQSIVNALSRPVEAQLL